MEEVVLHAFETPKRCRIEEDESYLLDNSATHGTDEESMMTKSEAQLKRGRPRAEVINHLIIEGSSSHSSIRCDICNRVFPREKSLQAHKRIHTGEKPYSCDYPSCGKAFTQSGQLKTHQRLHTGEKPFMCTVAGCNSRFTHANRHCADHPYASLRRCHELALQPLLLQTENSPEVLRWLENYKRRNDEKTPGKLSDNEAEPNSSRIKRHKKTSWSSEQENQHNEQNRPRRGKFAKALQYESTEEVPSAPLYRTLCEAVEPSVFGCTPLQWSPNKSRNVSSGYESLLQDFHLNSTLESSHEKATENTPIRPEKPKRRWLREALTNNEQYNANMNRPSVIITSPRVFEPSSTSTPAKPNNLIRALQNAEKQWTGAIALMQLASSTHC